MTARTSLTPALSADSWAKRRLFALATSSASVVLPVPGGPYRISDIGASPSTRRRSGEPGPSRCCWPTTSSRVRGRIRAASGAFAATARRRASGSIRPSDGSVMLEQATARVTSPAHWPALDELADCGVDAGFLALLGRDRGRRAGQRVEAAAALRERDDLADRVDARQQRADPVPAERDPAVRRRAVGERRQQEAELLLRLLLGQAP